MNILDYLTWRGDLSLEASAFNEVDNLVISQMSYTNFDKYIDPNKQYTIKEISDTFFSKTSKEEIDNNKSLIANAQYVLKAMAESNRFKNAIIHDFVSKIDLETTEQFCAFCVDLSDDTTYVVFRGTDDTLVGWKEDLLLSYRKIKAQDEALAYLNKVMKPNRKYRVGGHSKGGNLAEFACVCLSEDKQDQLLGIYSNDGPGNKSSFLPDNYQEIYERLNDKLFKFVPEVDVFGCIYSNKFYPTIIKSEGIIFMQHDAMNWNVVGTKFVRGQETIQTTTLINSYKEFLNSVSDENKKVFVEELFNALEEANLKNISDVSSGGLPVIIRVLRKFSSLNEETKKTANLLVETIIKQSTYSIANEANSIKDDIIDKLHSKENKVKRKLKKIKNK